MRAELYALTHRGNAGDSAFYRELCRGAARILELGSGSGRLLAALAGPRRRVVGLERDPELLRLARRTLHDLKPSTRASVHFWAGDMRNFESKARFERVLLPYNALYCLLSQRDALHCFRAAHRALDSGGLFALDVWNAASFHHAELARGPENWDTPIASVAHAGRSFDVYEQLRIRRREQRLLATYHYVPREFGDTIRIPIAQRYFLAAEVEALLLRAGFEISGRFGSFARTRYSSRSAHLIVVARKPD